MLWKRKREFSPWDAVVQSQSFFGAYVQHMDGFFGGQKRVGAHENNWTP